jgi:hypothetical protein
MAAITVVADPAALQAALAGSSALFVVAPAAVAMGGRVDIRRGA